MNASLKDIAAHGGLFCLCCQKFTELDPDSSRYRCMNKAKSGRVCGSYRIKTVPPVPGCQDSTGPSFPEVHV